METSPVTCRTLEDFYHINGHTFEKQYKETLSGYRGWEQLSHADKWVLFPENIGKFLAIDEVALSNGELYTLVTNRDKHGKEGCLVAIVAGTKSDEVCKILDKIDEQQRERRVNQQVQNYNTRLKNSCFGVEKFNFSLGLSFNFFCIEIILLSV